MSPEFWISLTWAAVVLTLAGAGLWAYRADRSKELETMFYERRTFENGLLMLKSQFSVLETVVSELKDDVGKIRLAQGFGKHQ